MQVLYRDFELLMKTATHVGVVLGKDTWVYGEVAISVYRDDFINYDLVEDIALNQLGMDSWQFDYWMGIHGINIVNHN